MIMKPLDDEQINTVQGVSDLLFEVMYGASQDLHSKFEEILNCVLDFQKTQMIRFLFLKLFNSIDAAK